MDKIKLIKVSEDTWRELSMRKIDLMAKTYDGVIKYLLTKDKMEGGKNDVS